MKGDVLRLYSMRFCPFAQVGFLNQKLSLAMIIGHTDFVDIGEGVF